MNPLIVSVGLAVACASVGQGGGGTHFEVQLPPDLASRETHLLLRNVQIPRDRAIVLRAYALDADAKKIFLGSTGMPGVSPDSSGTTLVNVLRIIVTRGIREWSLKYPNARTVVIEVGPSDGRAGPIEPAGWKVGAVELVHPD